MTYTDPIGDMFSRIALRDMASSGKIPGITKSSW